MQEIKNLELELLKVENIIPTVEEIIEKNKRL
jgi:hypothetical protein